MTPLNEQEEFEFRLRAESESSAQQAPIMTQKQPSGFSKFTTNISRPGAAIRERIRSLGRTGNIDEMRKAGDEAWANPESSETFQNENLRKLNQALPESANTLSRYTAGTIPSAVGLAEDFLTDPVQLGVAALTEGAMGKLSPIKFKSLSLGERASKLPIQNILSSAEGQAGKAAKQSGIAIKNVERLLKPNGDFSKDIQRGGTSNMVEQASKYVQPAKNYTEVVDQMEMAKGFPMEERAKVYRENKASPLFHDELQKLRSKVQSSPQATSRTTNTASKTIDDIFTADVESLNSATTEQLSDPNFYQKRKEFYQVEADKAGAYGGDEKMSMKAEAYRALARDYQNKTYSLNEEVLPLNLENAGLEEASSRASELAQVERGQAPDSISKDIVESIRPSKENIIATLIRKLTGDRFNNVRRFTKGASRAQAKSEKAQEVADLISKLSQAEDSGTLEYPKQLMAPTQAQIGVDRRVGIGKALQNQGTGPTIPVPGNTTHFIPETLESDLQSLAKKYNVPEYSGVRQTISNISKTPRGSLGKVAMKALARRKKNFGG